MGLLKKRISEAASGDGAPNKHCEVRRAQTVRGLDNPRYPPFQQPPLALFLEFRLIDKPDVVYYRCGEP